MRNTKRTRAEVERLKAENAKLGKIVADSLSRHVFDVACELRDAEIARLRAELAELRAAVRRLVRIGSDGGMHAFAVDPDEWGYLAHHEIAAIRAAVEEKV